MQLYAWFWYVVYYGPSNIRGVHQRWSWPRVEWYYIPASVGFGVICFIQLKHMWKRKGHSTPLVDDDSNLDVSPSLSFAPRYVLAQWQVDVLKNLPTRAFSRCWGYLCNLHIPKMLRSPLLGSYSYMFDCNLEEAVKSEITSYSTFNDFFTRTLKPNARIVHPTAALVSPADSTVLTFGTLPYPHLNLDQVKGFSYPLNVFVGPRHPFMKGLDASFSNSKSYSGGSTCVSNASTEGDDYKIFYVSMYLAPGDYHWFHSPTEWTIEHRRHIPGHLFSVNPRVLRSINGIFNFNERVILSGHWQHGLFMYAAVGAYNVGSIKLNSRMERDFLTNSMYTEDVFKDRLYGTGALFQRGDSLGGFELGSSLVLVFTAPKDFQFNIKAGQKLKYGQPIGMLVNQDASPDTHSNNNNISDHISNQNNNDNNNNNDDGVE